MYTRHFLHRISARVRYGRNLKAFVAAQTTRLTVATVKATQTLTASANFGNTETVTIGAKVYTFQTSLTNVDGNVKIGVDLATSLVNLKNAITGSGGTPGTDYAATMTAHPTVDSVSSNATTLVVRAKATGTGGNAIVTTETAANAAWGAATLAGGVNAVNPDIYDLLHRNTSDQIAAAASVAVLK